MDTGESCRNSYFMKCCKFVFLYMRITRPICWLGEGPGKYVIRRVSPRFRRTSALFVIL